MESPQPMQGSIARKAEAIGNMDSHPNNQHSANRRAPLQAQAKLRMSRRRLLLARTHQKKHASLESFKGAQAV